MINCTKHSIERWTERIIGIKTKQERDNYIRDSGEQIKENMNKTFSYTEFIYKGQLGTDNITRNYFIHNDIIFVTNTTNDAIVTCYKIDFNFTPEINLLVAKGLLQEIHRLTEEKEKSDLTVLENMDILENDLANTNAEIDILKEQIKVLESKKKSIEIQISNISSNSKVIELEMKKHVNNLVNSKEYREDIKSM